MFKLCALPALAVAAKDNLLTNGDFEESGGWTALNSYPGILDVVTDVKHSDTSSLRITNDSTMYEVGQTIEGLTPGAVYEFKAYASVQGGNAALARCVAKYQNVPEGYTDEYSQITISGDAWFPVTYKISPPPGCTSIRFYIRNFTANTVMWYDDVSVRKIENTRLFEMVPSQVFYYTDTSEEPVITVKKTDFFTPQSGDTVDFTLLDGDTRITGSTDASFSEGVASFSFPLKNLETEKKAYTVHARLKRGGATLYEETQNVYKYPRPSMMDKKGDIYINGERFLPKVALACDSTAYYENLAKAGFNAVTVYSGHLRGAIPYLKENNLKAVVPLYSKMYPAGHPQIAEDMAAIVKEFKDSDVVLGWQPMDEPGMNLSRLSYDELMEASYKMIRDIDSKHPVLLVDADENLYHKHAWYSDAVLCDAYTAYGGRDYTADYVIRNMEKAVEEAKGKPVWYISGTFERDGYFMNADEYRNVMWQSFMAGAKGYGVYPVINVYKQGGTTPEKEGTLPDTTLWQDMLAISARGEMELAFRHFVEEKTVPLTKYRGDTLWWETWYDNGNFYAVILNRQNTSQSASIPLKTERGTVLIESGRANRIDGKSATRTVSGGAFPVNLTAYEAAIYTIPTGGTESQITVSAIGETHIKVEAVAFAAVGERVAFITATYTKENNTRKLSKFTVTEGTGAGSLPVVLKGVTMPKEEGEETVAYLWSFSSGIQPIISKIKQ